jgi:integrase
MARQANRLTAIQAAKAPPGLHGDGAGLYLRVSATGSAFWLFIYQHKGKRREMGLGAARGAYSVSLASAREGAAEARRLIGEGKCPIEEARKTKAVEEVHKPTFGEVAAQLLKNMRPKWRSPIYARQWEHSLTVKAATLAPLPVDTVGVTEILEVLEPVWREHPETGRRFRGMLEAVMDAATARGYRTGPNPAAWRNNLRAVLPAIAPHQRKNLAAMPYGEMAAFISQLRAKDGVAARALEFCVLTVARTSEVRLATWSQIDWDNRVWLIPPDNTKGYRLQRTPLSERAMEILREMKEAAVSEAIFPSYHGGPLSMNGMLAVVRKGLGIPKEKACVHGFRSTFRDAAGDVFGYPSDVIELAMSHKISNKAEAAYRRSDALERRVPLMAKWAEWCEPKPEGGNVVTFQRPASA